MTAPRGMVKAVVNRTALRMLLRLAVSRTSLTAGLLALTRFAAHWAPASAATRMVTVAAPAPSSICRRFPVSLGSMVTAREPPPGTVSCRTSLMVSVPVSRLPVKSSVVTRFSSVSSAGMAPVS